MEQCQFSNRYRCCIYCILEYLFLTGHHSKIGNQCCVLSHVIPSVVWCAPQSCFPCMLLPLAYLISLVHCTDWLASHRQWALHLFFREMRKHWTMIHFIINTDVRLVLSGKHCHTMTLNPAVLRINISVKIVYDDLPNIQGNSQTSQQASFAWQLLLLLSGETYKFHHMNKRC